MEGRGEEWGGVGRSGEEWGGVGRSGEDESGIGEEMEDESGIGEEVEDESGIGEEGFRKISHSLNFFSLYDGEKECRGYTLFPHLITMGKKSVGFTVSPHL